MNTLLYVRNLPLDVTTKQLNALFSQAGEVLDVYLITDRWTATPKGFGFVQMKSEKAAKKAVQLLHGTEWLNRMLIVRFTTPNDEEVARIALDKSMHG